MMPAWSLCSIRVRNFSVYVQPSGMFNVPLLPPSIFLFNFPEYKNIINLNKPEG